MTNPTSPPETATSDKQIAGIIPPQSGSHYTGWYYYDESYPDEGSVGPFDTEAEAVKHAEDAGYEVTNG